MEGTRLPEGKAVISRRGAERLQAGHLWIYRSDLREAEAGPGDVVRVSDERGGYLGRAFYSDRSQIALRLVTREDVPIDREFLAGRIHAAAAHRERVVQDTEAYRLVYGEADLLPGLVVDRYSDFLVVQTLCQATDRLKQELLPLLLEIFSPRAIVERNDPKVRLLEGLERRVGVLHGEVPEEVQANVNGVRFAFDLLKGQKTGGFLDQRENQRAAVRYAQGDVLDCFAYAGGFALTVAKASRHVEAVDLAPSAVELGKRNQGLNQIGNVTFREANAFDVLKEYDQSGRTFDMVILDPPAFAKNRESVPAAERGYKEINLRALKILRPGGYLVTCSCSYHLQESLFLSIVAEAALDARRTVAVVERQSQARDHPILLTMPETHYLKCMIIRVII
jgi:23S rRNA (cytosine1962-C5)-methyltransferase